MDKLPNIHPGEVLREEFLAPLGGAWLWAFTHVSDADSVRSGQLAGFPLALEGRGVGVRVAIDKRAQRIQTMPARRAGSRRASTKPP